MQSSKELRTQITNYLTQNPIDNTQKDKYHTAAQKFNVDKEYIRSIWRTLKQEVKPRQVTAAANFVNERSQVGDNLSITVDTKKRVKTLEDLIEICEIDLTKWNVVSWECTKWEVGRTNKTVEWQITNGQVTNGDVSDQGNIFVEPLYRVKAKLALRKIDTDLSLQKELLVKELFSYAPKFDLLETFSMFRDSAVESANNYKKNCLLELCLFDPHFGKLAHAEESGKDEDIKITSQKYKEAIEDLISRVNIDCVERILLPIGNDMINIDGNSNQTTAGTPQTVDSRFYKIVQTVKEVLIETIDKLAVIAPVDVVVVKGNHDSETMFLLGEILQAYYHNTDVVTIDNAPTYRKYYQYGNTGIQLTHGNEEPHQSLGLIFATERPELWADVKFRYCQTGHFHKSKKTQHVSVDEHQGFQVVILPSLSFNDSWHNKRGYNSLKQAKAFLIDVNDGIIAELTHTCNL